MSQDLYAGPGHTPQATEVHRRSSGRLRYVVARETDGSWWLHVQPAPSLTSMSRRFRESHALHLMGFEPVTASRFFPAACTFAGCYSRPIVLPDAGEVDDEVAAQITQKLEPAVDALMNLAFELQPIGLDLIGG